MAVTLPRSSGGNPHRIELFEQWGSRIPATHVELATAIRTLAENYKNLAVQHERFGRDESSTPGARLVKSAKAARVGILPLFDKLDSAVAGAAERARLLQEKITTVYNPPNKQYETVMRHQEIRAHFKSLPRTQALQELEAARKAGDEDTLVALASSQRFLSGLPPEMHQNTRDHLIGIHAPREAEALAQLQEQKTSAEQFKGAMLQSIADMIDFVKADEIIAAASSDVAA